MVIPRASKCGDLGVAGDGVGRSRGAVAPAGSLLPDRTPAAADGVRQVE